MQLDEEVEKLLSEVSEASLGTLSGNHPHVSSVGVLYEPGSPGKIVMLLSDLARHTVNLKKCDRASLLMADRSSNAPVHSMKRASIDGRITSVRDPARHEALKKAYIKRFPESKMFFQLPDFRFYEMTPEEIYWYGGFGKARSYT